MDLRKIDIFRNIYSDMINKNRPAEPEPVVLDSRGPKDNDIIVPNRSPRWQKSTKQAIVIGLIAALLICAYFLRNMIAPLIMAAILTYFMRPAARFFNQRLNFSWKWSTAVVYILLILVVLGLIAWGGISIFSQVENLINFISGALEDLPGTINDWVGKNTDPVSLYIRSISDSGISTQIKDSLQGMLGDVAGKAGGLAQSISSKIGWFFFVIGFSFFVVWESGVEQSTFEGIHVEGYDYDIEMGRYQLSRIWNRFVSGQVSLMGITVVVYAVLFGILRVHYAFLLACAAALTRLVPYVGSFVAWTIVCLVCLFQKSTIFGLLPLPYAILVVGLAFLIDKFMDGFIQPKFLADTLKVHPAMVLASALICARIMGVLGIFLAAPVLATLKLLLRYLTRKLQDKDPWEGIETVAAPVPLRETLETWKKKLLDFWQTVRNWVMNLFKKRA